MKKRVLISGLSILFAFSIASCSGSIQLEVPPVEAVPEEESSKIESPSKSEQKPLESTGSAEPADIHSLVSLQNAYISIYEDVLPSVVSISVTKTVTGAGFELPEIPFDFDFNTPPDDEPFEYQESAAGSGFVWDTGGHIVTNNHVIEGGEVIRVSFADGRSVLAELVGADADSDLAVLKIDLPKDTLVPISVSDSTTVQVGQIAVAIGNPFQLESSMTTGIISGIGRSLPLASTDGSGFYYSIPDVIQTDAAINPGNSGGVLVDINGGLIGVTTAIESPVRANAGVGYVIPSVIVEKIVPILIRDGKFEQPWIGISGRDMIPEFAELMDLDPKQTGALVIDITSDSPAEKSGLLGSSIAGTVDGFDVRVGGDVIIAADGIPVNDFEDLVAFLARHTIVGQTITLTIIRDGEEINLDLTLAARPVQKIIEEIPEPEEVSGSAWLGIYGRDLTSDIAEAMELPGNTSGALIEKITAGSPADEADLRGSYKPITINGKEVLIGGDIITAVDENDVGGIQDLSDIISSSKSGTTLSLSVLREGKEITIDVTLGERPE
jgi:S1-C subfamily serine protease